MPSDTTADDSKPTKTPRSRTKKADQPSLITRAINSVAAVPGAIVALPGKIKRTIISDGSEKPRARKSSAKASTAKAAADDKPAEAKATPKKATATKRAAAKPAKTAEKTATSTPEKKSRAAKPKTETTEHPAA